MKITYSKFELGIYDKPNVYSLRFIEADDIILHECKELTCYRSNFYTICRNDETYSIATIDFINKRVIGYCNLYDYTKESHFYLNNSLELPSPHRRNLNEYLKKSPCINGGDDPHVLKIGYLLSTSFYNFFDQSEDDISFLIEAMSNNMNMVLKNQINLEIEVAQVYILTSATTIKTLANMPNSTSMICNEEAFKLSTLTPSGKIETDFLLRLSQISKWVKCLSDEVDIHEQIASVQYLDRIDSVSGGGLAWLSNLCVNTGLMTGVNNYSDKLWRTIIHELAHNMGAKHPLSPSGSVLTDNGGIMGYIDKTYDGIEQYSPDSLNQLCSYLSNTLCSESVFYTPVLTVTPTVSTNSSGGDTVPEVYDISPVISVVVAAVVVFLFILYIIVRRRTTNV